MSATSGERELCFLKLGGSLITDKSKPYTARREVIERLGAEIRAARQARDLDLVVGHGGGSFPHISARRHRTHLGIADENSWEGFIEVQRDAARLNQIVCAGLKAAGEKVVPIQPSAACVARDRRIVAWSTRPIEMLLAAGLIPVPYGDVGLDEAQGCCILSTEEIFRFLAGGLKPARIILAGKVDGVLDARGELIPRISAAEFPDIRAELGGSDGVADVTGGMLLKVETSLKLGVQTEIINGLEPGRLERALLGEEGLGTMVEAQGPDAGQEPRPARER